MIYQILSLLESGVRVFLILLVILTLCFWAWKFMIQMPGVSYTGPLPLLTQNELEIAQTLSSDIEMLSAKIGPRNLYHPRALSEAAAFIEKRFKEIGFSVTQERFECEEKLYCNLIAEIKGTPAQEEIIIIGAHYDTAGESPGANDNGSGVAALLALAQAFSREKPSRTLRFVAFANEEPPFFKTECMGSWVHAKGCKRRHEKIFAMFSLETIGYYSDARWTQMYPPPLSLFYPSTGNFIAFVSNLSNQKLLKKVMASFRKNALFPSEGAALPSWIPGVDWSDHWSFWKEGYPALMITDTAPFRYPQYHSISDTPDKIDYGRLARVVNGIKRVIQEMAAK